MTKLEHLQAVADLTALNKELVAALELSLKWLDWRMDDRDFYQAERVVKAVLAKAKVNDADEVD